MEDKDIVKLYWDRDKRAIAETAEKYGNYCKSIALNILQSHEDAQECVNDTYLNTWNSIPPHRPQLLSTFLGKIVRNLSFNRYKAEHSQKRGGYETALILDEIREIVSGKENVEDEATAHELISEINSFIDGLGEEKRYIFIRRYWYADSVMYIAGQCKKSENAVSAELSRIRKKLCDYLTERGYEI